MSMDDPNKLNLKNCVLNIYSFDGQTVWSDKETELFEVGNFLGGGAAGNVYECEHIHSHRHYALKILNPIGYKIMSPTLLRKCTVVSKGKIFSDADKTKESRQHLKLDNLWWLLSSTKQYIACCFSERHNSIRELSLNQCVQIWGSELSSIGEDDSNGQITSESSFKCAKDLVPLIPQKFLDFVRRRSRIFREIRNMEKINNHVNVIQLEGVLELIQESKCTIFLVMELANGGELFDRIKLDCGTREDTANFFFQQLLLGVKHCHDQGICHRDLKPENLLLQDLTGGDTILKVADFGFSARFAMSFDNLNDINCVESDLVAMLMPTTVSESWLFEKGEQGTTPFTPSSSFLDESPLRVLKSVVGSPFYVAPEVMQAKGYDGPKADVWSMGVILYAMLAGNLPFGQELSVCKRFRHFCKWVREKTAQEMVFTRHSECIEFPLWLFPVKFSASAKGLIVSMLHPDPEFRISVSEAMAITASHFTMPERIGACDAAETTMCMDLSLGPVSESSSRLQVQKSSFNKVDSVSNTDMIGVVADEEEQIMFLMEEEQDVVSFPVVSQMHHLAEFDKFLEPQEVKVCKKLMFSDCVAPVGSPPVAQLISVFSSSSTGTYRDTPPVPPHPVLCSLSEYPLLDDLLCLAVVGEKGTGKASSIGLHKEGLVQESHERDTIARFAYAAGGSLSACPPSFSDTVKRSTRFITYVPAAMVLDKVEAILEQMRFQRLSTPIGFIGKVVLDWERYSVEVWGLDTQGPALCALHVYLMPPVAMDPQRDSECQHEHDSMFSDRKMFLVEFIRGQLGIFDFKRFYQWVRFRLSELVQQDYSTVCALDQNVPI